MISLFRFPSLVIMRNEGTLVSLPPEALWIAALSAKLGG